MRKNKWFIFFLLTVALNATPLGVCADETEMLDLMPMESNSTPKTEQQTVDDIDITESFTGNLSKNKNSSSKEEKRSESESWLKSLISHGTNEILKSKDAKVKEAEEKRIEQVIKNRRSNASTFDISGIKLRMSPQEIAGILKTHGYKKLAERKEIPNFIRWRGEELCRINGVVGFERLNVCATRIAIEHNYQFIEYELYNKYDSRETIEVQYTSNFTDNLAHYISYRSNIPLSDSKASKNIYLNNLKIFDWWRRVDMKYGEPDNKTEVKWGLGGKKPFLKAGQGTLELSDPLLKNLDASRMINEDSRFANTQYYTF